VIPVDSFRTRIKGPVIEPFDPDYSAVVVGGIDRLVSLIMLQADATDVGAAIGVARQNGLELAVRSGGHSAMASGSWTAGSSALRDLPEIASDTKAANKGR
jgi:hypothetical protein